MLYILDNPAFAEFVLEGGSPAENQTDYLVQCRRCPGVEAERSGWSTLEAMSVDWLTAQNYFGKH